VQGAGPEHLCWQFTVRDQVVKGMGSDTWLHLTRWCWQCKVRDQSEDLKELLKLEGKASDAALVESVLEVPPAR